MPFSTSTVETPVGEMPDSQGAIIRCPNSLLWDANSWCTTSMDRIVSPRGRRGSFTSQGPLTEGWTHGNMVDRGPHRSGGRPRGVSEGGNPVGRGSARSVGEVADSSTSYYRSA